jgi:hypothetical protein
MSQFQPLVRNHYFAGKLMSAEDFQREQDYLLGRLRRRNRFLSGWGVVAGLGVSVERGETVVVQPGFAIDCAGNEVIVETETRLSLTGLSRRQHVLVRYVEVPETTGGDATEMPEPSGIREASCIELSPLNPSVNHRGMGCGTPGCGLAHAVSIAVVVLSQKTNRWKLASFLRPLKFVRR